MNKLVNKVMAIFTAIVTAAVAMGPLPVSAFTMTANGQVVIQTISLGNADLSFPQNPSFNLGTLTMPWGNTGFGEAKFQANKVVYTITAVDANGARIPKSILVNGISYGNPYYGTSGNNGTGYWSIPAGKTFTTVLKNTVLPVGTSALIFQLDPNGLITEASEVNNRYVLSVPQIISSSGALMVTTDVDTPVADNNLMGAVNQDIAKFKISASSTEAVNINQLVVSAKFSYAATGTMTNIRLIDQDTGAQVGSAVSSFSDVVAGVNAANGTFSHATFSGLNFNIPAGQSKVLVMRADFTTYQNGGFVTTGQTFQPVILKSYYGVGHNPITATGVSSGTSLDATISETGSKLISVANPGAYGSAGTLYRAKLTTAWASDTPRGAASPGAAQIIAKVRVTNILNIGSYSATVKYLNLQLATTIGSVAGVGANRTLTVYKDSLASTPIATTNFVVGQKLNGVTGIGDVGFTDVEIASGETKTFFVTMDTTDATSAQSLSLTVPNNAITWTDGINGNITGIDNTLPLAFNTLTY